MWHDHTFSQRNNKSKIALEVKAGGIRKKGLENIGRLHNLGVVRNLLPTMNHKELFWKMNVLII